MTTTISQLAKMNQVKRNMARVTWNALRANLHEWTYDVSNALPRGKYYEMKYFWDHHIQYRKDLECMNLRPRHQLSGHDY